MRAVDLTGAPGQIIDANGIRLRPYQSSDIPDVAAGCADPLTQRFLPGLPGPYTRRDAVWWINEGAPAAWVAGGAAYAIVDPATDRLLGGAGMGRVTMERGQAEIGYWVAPWARGVGVARAAASTLADWAFARGFGRLELLTAWENEASQRVAMAAGFRREGVRRDALIRRDGGRYDAVAWARLAADPPGPAPRLLPDLPGGALSDGVVALRPLAGTDADFLYALQTLPDVVATSLPPVAPDRHELELRCARSGARWLAGERADLVIPDAATGRPAGLVGLYYQEPMTGQAMIGYCMLPAWRGRGYATRATRLVARWAFAHVGVGRLVAGTLPSNTGSRRVLERAGFRPEGHLRGRLPGPTGGRLDDLLYGLLPEDLAALPPETGAGRPPAPR
jgi:RimJ/RimL family protein N-acetyltransferase